MARMKALGGRGMQQRETEVHTTSAAANAATMKGGGVYVIMAHSLLVV